MSRLSHWFPKESIVEFTVEANPETVDEQKIAILADHGVNRISLGAQSFQPQLLTILERRHSPGSVEKAVELVRKRIDNFSLDLIFGVPGQTLEQWSTDVDRLLSLGPRHCSAYGLTYEKGTPLWRQRKDGIVRPVDEEVELAMFDGVAERLYSAGFLQYEISNFAEVSFRSDDQFANQCRHNLTYWANQHCYGFGTGAAAYVNGTRTLNTRELGSYIDRCLAGISPISQSETLEPLESAKETAILNLRRIRGIDLSEFHVFTGMSLLEIAGPEIEKFLRHGLLEQSGDAIRFTRRGLALSDTVFASLVA